MAYPIPRADELIELVGDQHPLFLSKIDMKMAFFQVPIREEDREKTAFRLHQALYEYNCLPMGTCLSAQLFQKIMNSVLADMPKDKVFTYLDDVLIATQHYDVHVVRVVEIVRKVRLA